MKENDKTETGAGVSSNDARVEQGESRIKQANVHAERAEHSEQTLRASELSYRRLFEAARDGILILDIETGRISDVNPFLAELLGYSHGEMVGKTVGELSPFKDIVSNQAMLERLQRDGYVRYENLPLQTKDGRHIEVEFVSNVYLAGDVKVIQCNIRDVTLRKLTEFRLNRLNRLHTVLSKIAEAIVRMRDRQELYDKVCRIVVEDGLLRMVYIAEVDVAAKLARPVAAYGAGQEYLREPASVIPTDGGPLSMGTVGTAIRTGVPDFCNDIAGAARMKPWRETALKYGLLAKASFPLKLNGATVAVLVLYAGETGYFLDDEIRLMATIANNLSFALEALDKEQRHQRDEEALRESEERFRNMFTATATGIAMSTPQGRFLQANAAYCQMLGYTEEELRASNFAALTHPDDLALNLKLRDEVLAGQRNSFVMEKRYLKKGGAIVWTRHSISASRAANGEIKLFIVVAENITERKQTEEKLQQRQTELQVLFDLMPAMVWFKDTNNGIVRLNQRAAQITGKTVGELEGKSMREIYPLEAAKYYADDLEVIHSRMPKLGINETLRNSEGKELWVQTDKVPVCDKDGKVSGIVVMVQDITERKKIETRFRRLVDSNVQGVFFWNTKGEITDGNESFLKLIRYTREDLKAGRIGWSAMTPPEYAHLDERAQKEIAATGVCAPYEKEFIRSDGTRVPILIGAAIFEDNPDEGICFVLDLTESKKLEQQFRQAQKMEGFGQLAGGVAHDFNNILAVIQIQADLFLDDSHLSPAQLDCANEIKVATQRASTLTRQLLLFSRKEIMQPRDLDLSQSINGITNMLRRILGEDIQMQFKFSLQPLFLHADAGMMDQVLMNLAVNARDAMPNGGRLAIETSAVDFDETVRVQSAQARAGSFVCLSVSDSGCGIPPEILPKIFEPFFTTKEVGKGTGLGLATVFGIVQQHQGWINVYSEVGHGTTFRIYLPRLNKLSSPVPPPSPLKTERGGNETILLVEDEPSLRTTVRMSLTRLGYQVLETTNGIEALKVWQAHGAEIHLLLTDLVMPGGMTGKELADQLLEKNPKLKVIYASGYSAGIVNEDFSLEEGVNFLTKPFQSSKLAKIVRAILDTPADAQ